jgi:hypothetical protein
VIGDFTEGDSMTSLELTLANVLASIEQAKCAGNAHALIGLLQRKHAICESLAAPEQSWLEPATEVTSRLPALHQVEKTALAAA